MSPNTCPPCLRPSHIAGEGAERSEASHALPQGARASADSVRAHGRRRTSAVLHPVVTPQKVGAELVEARAADLAHHEVDFAAEDVDHLVDAGKPTGDRAIERRPAEEHELG